MAKKDDGLGMGVGGRGGGGWWRSLLWLPRTMIFGRHDDVRCWLLRKSTLLGGGGDDVCSCWYAATRLDSRTKIFHNLLSLVYWNHEFFLGPRLLCSFFGGDCEVLLIWMTETGTWSRSGKTTLAHEKCAKCRFRTDFAVETIGVLNESVGISIYLSIYPDGYIYMYIYIYMCVCMCICMDYIYIYSMYIYGLYIYIYADRFT